MARDILEVAKELGLSGNDVDVYGRGKAKISLDVGTRKPVGKARLILVTAINPTPAGEGKTTVSVGLAMGMRQLKKNVVLALREPSLGPVFGVKGGGTGGGKASLTPADDINLHFTGDIHAITTAHNLLSALVDNACHFRNVDLDPRQITWGRAMDMNDRFLRNCIVGLGGKAHGVVRQERFDITAASEVMAILALAKDPDDLRERLSRIIVGSTYDGKAVTAKDVHAAGAMTAVLKDAIRPNLVQTEEGGPALVHCGPFGNIAHGCNSVIATRMALALSDYTVTEAGFGFDLGGEKFLDIKCRMMGVWPRAVVLVATLRALKMHGGAPVKEAAAPSMERLEKGMSHLEKHIENARTFGLSPIVAINVRPNDPEDELTTLAAAVKKMGAQFARYEGFARGGEGALDLAREVCAAADASDNAPPAPKYVYELGDSPHDKIKKIARTVYGADDVAFSSKAESDLARIATLGYANLPICMAKTQLSLTDDPTIPGRPKGFTITVREVRLSAGAGFLVPLTGDMMTMPGLSKVPAANNIDLLPDGTIRGLMQ